MPFPSTISTFSRPTASDRLNNPSHSTLENAQSSAIGQLEHFIGTNASAVGTLTYDIRSPLSNGGGHIQTANKGGTGYTSYTKGDLIVGQSSSVLTKLAVSTDGYVLTADSAQATGVKWGAFGAIQPSIFSGTSGVWQRPSSISMVMVEVWGAGGSGGSRQNSGTGSGAGGGAYVTATYPASILPTAVSVIAAVGATAVGGNTAGNGGGASRFGSLLVAYGGDPGGSGTGSLGGGNGGSILSGIGSIFYGYGATTTAVGGNALYSGGGAGANGGNGFVGGNTIWGGAGGGAASSVASNNSMSNGAFSQRGGNGGKSSIVNASSIVGVAGSAPGGGGGGTIGAVSGAGGNGQVIIYMW